MLCVYLDAHDSTVYCTYIALQYKVVTTCSQIATKSDLIQLLRVVF